MFQCWYGVLWKLLMYWQLQAVFKISKIDFKNSKVFQSWLEDILRFIQSPLKIFNGDPENSEVELKLLKEFWGWLKCSGRLMGAGSLIEAKALIWALTTSCIIEVAIK